jgi:hypothetical protein
VVLQRPEQRRHGKRGLKPWHGRIGGITTQHASQSHPHQPGVQHHQPAGTSRGLPAAALPGRRLGDALHRPFGWNTLVIGNAISDDEILEAADASGQAVAGKLAKKGRPVR